MFWKKEKKAQHKIILGMIMLRESDSFNIDEFIKDYHYHYVDKIQELEGNNSAATFKIEGEMIAIGYMDFPIPSGDIEATARYAYNWQSALSDIKDHKSHLLVSVAHGGQDQIKRYKLFTQIICSLLRTTNAIGVYKGNQSLLIPNNYYLAQASIMTDEYLPLNLWIYFGLRTNVKGNSGYTYGLKEFNKVEMEILNTFKSLDDIRAFLFNIAHYVLENDVTFRDGETCGVTAEERIAIKFSKGELVEGKTFKLIY